MRNKIFLFIVFLLCASSIAFAQSAPDPEEAAVTLITYYPAPYGEYGEAFSSDLGANRMVIGDIDGDGEIYDGLPAADGGLNIAGAVGIGTDAPGAKLDVNGPAIIKGQLTMGTPSYKMPSARGANNQVLISDASGNVTWQNSLAGYWQQDGSNIYYNSGNVGIGTASPSYKLDVNGSAKVSSLRIGNYNMPSSIGSAGLVLKSNGSNAYWGADESGSGTTPPPPSCGWTLSGSTTSTGGNAFIGGTLNTGSTSGYGTMLAPDGRLRLQGGSSAKEIWLKPATPEITVGSKMQLDGVSGIVRLGSTSANSNVKVALSSLAGGLIYVGYPQNVKLFGTGVAQKTTGELWTVLSDVRLKENIRPINGALDKMLELQGITYKWKEPKKHSNMQGTYMGMIAQDVEKVFPEWVNTDDDGYKTLCAIGFDALAIEAIRELKEEIDLVREENLKLKEDIEFLKKNSRT